MSVCFAHVARLAILQLDRSSPNLVCRHYLSRAAIKGSFWDRFEVQICTKYVSSYGGASSSSVKLCSTLAWWELGNEAVWELPDVEEKKREKNAGNFTEQFGNSDEEERLTWSRWPGSGTERGEISQILLWLDRTIILETIRTIPETLAVGYMLKTNDFSASLSFDCRRHANDGSSEVH